MALPKLLVKIGADTKEFLAGIKRVQDGVDDTGDRMQRSAAIAAKWGTRIGLAAAAAGAAFVAASKSAARAATEIQNLSRLSGVGTTEFQKLAAAGRTVGFEQEKMGDIFKDVNDKFGDFMATGAGPLVDFFENIAPAIGVTAEQFASLSGPDALQLYVTSLERAGVSQQQMTFYMEALANDATALVPLLQNGGKAMKELGDNAERTGRIMGRDAVEAGVRLDRKFKELSTTIKTKAQAAVLDYSDELIAVLNWSIEHGLPALESLGRGFIAFAEDVGEAARLVQFFGKTAQFAVNIIRASKGLEPIGISDPTASPVGSATSEELEAAREEIAAQGGFDNALQNWADGDGKVLVRSPSKYPSGKPLVKPKKAGGGGGGGGSDLAGDLEALRESLLTQTEELELWREEQLEKLREFREAKLITEQEYNQLEGDINKKHQGAMADLNRGAMNEKLAHMSTVFSGLSALMQTENKKLFQIGKAAAIANAVVNGISAGVAAWEKGMEIGGPPLAVAFAAASMARTGAMISSLQSASMSGSSVGGGGGGVGGTGSTAEPPRTSSNVAIQLTGGDMYSRDQVKLLINQINEAVEDGAIVRLV